MIAATVALWIGARSIRKSAARLELAEPIHMDFLDAAEVLIGDDRTPDIVADLAHACGRLTQYRLVCFLWIVNSFRESDGAEYYSLLEEAVDSMDEHLLEQFHKLLGSFVLYTTLRAGLLGTILRKLVAPYVRHQDHQYKAAASGMDLTVGLVSIHPEELHYERAA